MQVLVWFGLFIYIFFLFIYLPKFLGVLYTIPYLNLIPIVNASNLYFPPSLLHSSFLIILSFLSIHVSHTVNKKNIGKYLTGAMEKLYQSELEGEEDPASSEPIKEQRSPIQPSRPPPPRPAPSRPPPPRPTPPGSAPTSPAIARAQTKVSRPVDFYFNQLAF